MRLSVLIKVSAIFIIISAILIKSLCIEVHTIGVIEASLWENIKVEFIVVPSWNFLEFIFVWFFTWCSSFFILPILFLRNFLFLLRLLRLSLNLLRKGHVLTLFLVLRFFNNRVIRSTIFHLRRYLYLIFIYIFFF